jgi:hypothetical protein
MTLLSDEEAAEIRSGLDGGTRGPILIKWVRQLLDDRNERVRRALEAARPAGSNPEDGGPSPG